MTLHWTKVGPSFWAEEWGNYFIRRVDDDAYRAFQLVFDEHVDCIGVYETLADAKRGVQIVFADHDLAEAAA